MLDALPAKRWTVGSHRIIRGDCTEQIDNLPAGSVDVIVTSPPYNIGIKYGAYRDRVADYGDFLRRVSAKLERVLKPDGSFFLNVGATNAAPWLAFEAASSFRGDFTLQNHIIWAKSLSIGEESYGHFKPIMSRRFLNHTHEAIFHFTKSGTVSIDRLAVGVPFKDKTNIARFGHSGDRRCGGDVWFIPYETVKSKAQKFNHPAGFPVELASRCIKLHGSSGGVVLDPFMGTGTTLVAADRLGHCGIGIEMDGVYALAAVDRLRSEVGAASVAA